MDNDFYLPTYIINLKKRVDRLNHIQDEFKDKNEFAINIVQATEHTIGAVGLWKSMVHIVNMAVENDDDVILICEDDHQFTQHYSKEYLFANIEEAYKQGADILCGGISGGFTYALPLTENRFWVDNYWCNQFIILYRKFFPVILNNTFVEGKKVDETLSGLTANKMVLFPFVSQQKFFGYSDVTSFNQEHPEWAKNRFDVVGKQLKSIQEVYMHYYR